jgi:endonuclease G
MKPTLEERVRAAVAAIERRDPKLAGEMASKRSDRQIAGKARDLEARLPEAAGGLEGMRPGIALETIVLRVGRPVLTVSQDAPILEFTDAESEVWRQRLIDAREGVTRAIRAVGRIELEHHHRFDWVGTGWLVQPNLIVTNRHVAQEFGRRSGSRFVFKQGRGGRTMSASVDFLEELDRAEVLSFQVRGIEYIEDDGGPDIALLSLDAAAETLAPAIPLSVRPARMDQLVAVVGYPARDSRIPDQQLMEDLFGSVYDKKRLAPGQIIGVSDGTVDHDCTTLGGNSGSVVLDLESGEAVGLHFAGRFLEANFAVPAYLVRERLTAEGRTRVASAPRRRVEGDATRPVGSAAAALARGSANVPVGSVGITSASCTVPVHVTVSIGAVVSGARSTPASSTRSESDRDIGDDDEFVDEEARPEDYADRPGYRRDFIGEGVDVPLPRPRGQLRADALRFPLDGKTKTVLKYQHFSVVMSRSRRLCLFSAVNVDGKNSRKVKRVGWRADPRIPRDAQIAKACYGNAPKFARGHMTRREDPIWGTDAALGNSDSMHVTNAVPQMQPFNAGIWLGLEDYALDNAREDDMRLSVFTGPFLRRNDPVRFGVRIPRSFWKVIAFIHDETRELCATGYTLNQDAFLREEEFVFGQHETSQVPISVIESGAGLSFGELSGLDPLAQVEEAMPRPLTDYNQIRFVP